MSTACRANRRVGASAQALLLALALLTGNVSQAQITIPSGTGDQMLSGMMGMMAEFSKQFQNSQGGGLSGGFSSMPMAAAQQAYNPMSGGMLGVPMSGMGSGMGQGLSQGLGQGFDQGFGQQMGQAGNAALGATGSDSLDGAWRGQQGEVLLIEGQRFRLHADRRRYLDGRLRRRGNIVGFLYPKRETALLYRYQISGDRLALQSRDRKIMVYQRVPMGR